MNVNLSLLVPMDRVSVEDVVINASFIIFHMIIVSSLSSSYFQVSFSRSCFQKRTSPPPLPEKYRIQQTTPSFCTWQHYHEHHHRCIRTRQRRSSLKNSPVCSFQHQRSPIHFSHVAALERRLEHSAGILEQPLAWHRCCSTARNHSHLRAVRGVGPLPEYSGWWVEGAAEALDSILLQTRGVQSTAATKFRTRV